jgi:uncharacterized membrane protein
MLIMALDHTRDFFSNALFDPLDLSQTTPAYFFTRWVTHFCAPVFVLLAGAGAYLYRARGRSAAEVARYLLIRGVLLIVLELTVIRFGWYFIDRPDFYLAQVIWALGWSMLFLAALVWLPTGLIVGIGLVIIAGHNLFDVFNPLQAALPTWLWTVLHQPGNIGLGDRAVLYVLYPLVPWVGVMAAGYGLGAVLLRPPAARRRWLISVGLALLAGFILIRGLNHYGDPLPWRPGTTALGTLLAFFNVEKYPPSLLFLLVTLGPALLALALLDRTPGPVGRVLSTYGRVPLFYYVLHLYLLHALAAWLTANGRFDLPGVYMVWLAVIALLYLPCRWYARFKSSRHEAVWKYI